MRIDIAFDVGGRAGGRAAGEEKEIMVGLCG